MLLLVAQGINAGLVYHKRWQVAMLPAVICEPSTLAVLWAPSVAVLLAPCGWSGRSLLLLWPASRPSHSGVPQRQACGDMAYSGYAPPDSNWAVSPSGGSGRARSA